MSPPAPKTLLDYRDRLRSLIGPGAWPDLERWSRLADLVCLRRSLPPTAPLVTVLLGPTGAGKSTLFNAALGHPLSATGAIRPCTGRPLAVGPVELLGDDPILRDPALGLEVRALPGGVPGRHVVVDTPDFDSVAEANRRAAEALLLRADRVVLVLSPEKYADAAVWAVLAEVRALGSAVACLLNKAEDDGALADCRRLLAEAGLPEPVPVPRLGRPDFLGSWPAGLPEELRRLLLETRDPPALLAARRVAAEECEARARAATVTPWIDGQLGALDRAEEALGRISAGLAARVRSGLPLSLGEALGRELQERFLERIQRYDLLREPRRWLAAPFRALRQVLPFLGPAAEGAAREGGGDSTARWLAQAHQERYRELLADLVAELRAVAREASAAAEPRLAWPAAPDPEAEEAVRSLAAAFAALQAELEAESERISQGLSPAGKAGFFGSQLVLNLVMLGVLVQTGGGLSLGDLAAQGLVSPYLARLAAQLVSSGEAAAVRRRLEDFLAGRLEDELRPRLGPLRDRAAELRLALGTNRSWAEAVRRWEEEGRRARPA